VIIGELMETLNQIRRYCCWYSWNEDLGSVSHWLYAQKLGSMVLLFCFQVDE